MKKLLLLVVLFGFMFVMVSCQKAPEVTVTKYFQAIKHNDKGTMSSMAVKPKFLQFKSYKISSVSEPVIGEYQLPILLQKMEEAKKQRKDLAIMASEKRDEVEALKDELSETRRASRKNELKKQIENAEVEFYAAEQEFKNLVKDMGGLKKQIEYERNLVNISTGITTNPENYIGKTEESTVRVNVVLTDESEAEYVFVLVKYAFMLNERELPSRLVILTIQTAEEFKKASQMAPKDVPSPTEEVSEEDPAEATNE
jgi:hypothetical protein